MKQWSTCTSFKSTSSDFLTDFGYKISETGFSIGTEFEQYENLFFSPEIDLTFEDLETNSSASAALKKQEGTYEDIYFKYGLNYDLRNSSYRPSSGNRTSFYQELPIVSGNNEITNTFIFTQYKTLNRSTEMIGKTSLYLKAINSLDGSDVRISKRGKIPYNRLRGFKKGRVGPVDSNNDYVGGNYATTINLEASLPKLLPESTNTDVNIFWDLGNLWGNDYDSSLGESNILRSSVGISSNWLSPIGPLSLTFAKDLKKAETDKAESFKFQLGTSF